MQLFLVFLIVAVALVYALWRVVSTWKSASDPCYGCDGCALSPKVRKTRMNAKRLCEDKKAKSRV